MSKAKEEERRAKLSGFASGCLFVLGITLAVVGLVLFVGGNAYWFTMVGVGAALVVEWVIKDYLVKF